MIKTLLLINKFYLSKKEKIKIILFSLFSLLIPLLEFVSVATLAGLVLFFIDFENSIKIIPFEFLKEKFLSLDKITLLKILSFIVFLAVLSKNIIVFLYYYFERKITKDMVTNHSTVLFKKHLALPYIDHTNLNSSIVQNDIINQTKKISTYLFFSISFFKDAVLSISFLTALIFINYKATILLVLLSAVIGVIFQILTSKKIEKLGAESRHLDSSLIKIVQLATVGIKTIILFLKKDFFKNLFTRTMEEYETKNMNYALVSRIPKLLIETLFTLIIVIFIFLFIKNDNSSKDLLPFFVSLSLISIRLIPLVSNINVVFSNLSFLEPAIKEITNNKDFLHHVSNKIKKYDSDLNNLNINSINLENICFSYPEVNKEVLSGINIEFLKGKIYCIIGESGSGKSTLLDIMLGLLKPSDGTISINKKIKVNTDDKSWFKYLSYVPQETFLLNDTLENNVCFAIERNEIDKNQLSKAIELSCLKDLYDEYQNNQSKIIGDRGIKISGGQRQRIGIARAFYKNNQVLVLDEATSALDEITENKLFENLQNLKKNKIIVLVSHRFNTIKSCDEVISIKRGKVSFVGKPEDL